MPANNVIQIVIRVVDSATAPIRQLTTQLQGMQSRISGLVAPTARTTQILGNLRTGATQLRSGMESLRKNIRGAFVAMTGWRTIVGLAIFAKISKEAFGFADVLRQSESKIRLVTTSTAQLNVVNAQLYDIAQKTRSEYESTVELYTRVARSADNLGASQRQILRFTESISKANVIAGSTTKEASAGVIQLGQALASGTLRGDELRSVLEQMPRVAQALATGLGVTRGELRALGEAGKLTSERLFGAILSQSVVLDEEFKKVTKTVAGAATQTRNALQKMVGEVLNATGTSDKLVSSLDRLTEKLDSPEAREGFANFVAGIVSITEAAASAIIKLGELYDRVDTSIKVDNLRAIPALLEKEEELVKKIRDAEESRAPLRDDLKNYYQKQLDETREMLKQIRLTVKEGTTLEGKLASGVNAGPGRRGSAVAEKRLKALLDEAAGKVRRTITDADIDKLEIKVLDADKTRIQSSAVDELVRSLNELTQTDLEAAVQEFNKFDVALDELISRGLDPAVANKRKEEFLDELIIKPEDLKSRKIAENPFNELTEFAKQAARNIQDSIATALQGAFDDGARGFLRSMLQVLQQILAQIAAANISKALGLEKLISGGLGAIFGKAGGGFASGLTRVGEEGPETLLLPPGSRVFNQRQMAFAGGGGANVTFAPSTSIVVQTSGDPREVERRLAVELARRDAKLEGKFSQMLRENGFGRMN